MSEPVAAAFAVASLYVCSLYLVPRHIRRLPRHHETHVKHRIAASGLQTVLSVVGTVVYLRWRWSKSLDRSLRDIGLGAGFWRDLRCAATGLTAVAVLFLGPLAAEAALAAAGARDVADLPRAFGAALRGEVRRQRSLLAVAPWQWWRNLVHAPVSEEIVYRGLLTGILRAGGTGPWRIILCAPLLFGVAHLHHLFEHVRNGGRFVHGVAVSLVQMSYTWLFGVIACILVLRTGSVWAGVAAHTFCNYMSVPDVGFVNGVGRLGSVRGARVALLAAYVAGVVLFCRNILPYTEGGKGMDWR